MDAVRVAVAVVLVAGIGLFRFVSTLNSAPAGFTIVAKYPTREAAEEARAFLGHHGVRAEVEDRRRAVKMTVWHGTVLVMVPKEQLGTAKRAFAMLARTSGDETSSSRRRGGGAA
jgi:hypothetical protein